MFSNNSKDNPQGVDVFKVYFKPIPDKANAWKCLCDVELQQNTKNGQTNLLNHVYKQHTNWKQVCIDALNRGESKNSKYFI
jgi:hypothetical protein